LGEHLLLSQYHMRYSTAHSVHDGLVCRWTQTFHNTDILGLLYSCGYCYPVCNSIQFLELLREIDAQLLFKIHMFTFQTLVTRLNVIFCFFKMFECCFHHSFSNLFLISFMLKQFWYILLTTCHDRILLWFICTTI
jgi:hypothetical protein